MNRSLMIRIPWVVALALPTSAQTLLQTHTGSVGDEYGAAVHPTADQNGDGYVDLLVGAPGWNSDRGYVRALSGKFLATGTGPAILWTYYHSTITSGARLGSSIIEVGTLTGDSATDYVVGVPGDAVGSVFNGGVLLIDGSTHAFATAIFGNPNTHLGASLAAVGDQDGDGKVDIAATAPSTNGGASYVHIISGASFGTTQQLSSSIHSSLNANNSSLYGETIASGFDLDLDGRFDLAIGSPRMTNAGFVEVVRADFSWTPIASYSGLHPGERMGSSIDARHDVNQDGVVDLILGAPGYDSGFGNEAGRAVVLSGLRLVTATTPLDLYSMYSGSGLTAHFGACVRASPDLNHDGTGDFIVGMPSYYASVQSGLGRGGASIYSGKTGVRLGILVGNPQDRLGDALLGAHVDMDHEGFPEFAVAGSLSDNSSKVDCGALKFYRLFPGSPSLYCTAKTNSLGCVPSITWSGTISAGSSAPFLFVCSNVLNQVNGLFYYSHVPAAVPFQGGTMCVNTPLKRLPVIPSGGNPGSPDCSGLFSYDFGAYRASGADATLTAGSEVFAQCWSRDPASASTTSLSNGLRVLINP